MLSNVFLFYHVKALFKIMIALIILTKNKINTETKKHHHSDRTNTLT